MAKLGKNAFFGGALAIALVLTSVGSAFADAADPADSAVGEPATSSEVQQSSVPATAKDRDDGKRDDDKKHDDDGYDDDDKYDDDDEKKHDKKKHDKKKHDKKKHDRAKLKLVKVVENEHGGTAEPEQFTLQARNGTGPWKTYAQNTWLVVKPGSYELRESGPDGYRLVSLTCTDSPKTSADKPTVKLSKGDRVTCTFTNRDTKNPPRHGEVKLMKVVDSPYGGTAAPGDWELVLRESGGSGSVLPQNTWVTVSPGDYDVYEQGGPAGYTQTGLSCENLADPSADAQSTASFTVAAGDRWACTFTNTQDAPPPPTVDVGIEKTHSTLDGGAVEPGQTYSYFLTVTNHGTGTAYDTVVTDLIPAPLVVDDVIAPVGWTVDDVDGLLIVTIPELAAGGSGAIEVVVTLVDPGSELIGSIANEACVEAEGDTHPLNDCSTVTIPVDQLIADVWVTCVNDAPYLHYSVLTSESLQGRPITLTWTPDTDVPTPVPASVQRTLQSGDTGRIAWPGAAFASNGVSIDWPGYRPLAESDYDPVTGALLVDSSLVYNGMVLDTSDATFPWRLGTTVTISVNPTAVFQVEYPPPSENCEVPRNAGLEITKTASVTTTAPGESFTYGIAVRNVSVDSAADPVTLTDPIPASLRVDSITTSTGAFPRWRDCEVTGTDAAGYGGTLTCTLLGPLMMGQSAPTVTLGVTVSEKTTASKIVNVGEVCWGNGPNSELIGCNDDDVTVSVAGFLPVTGGENGLAGVMLGVLAILGGALLMAYGPLRRRRGIPDRIV